MTWKEMDKLYEKTFEPVESDSGRAIVKAQKVLLKSAYESGFDEGETKGVRIGYVFGYGLGFICGVCCCFISVKKLSS